MARTDPQLNIRMPSDLKERLEGAARDSGRSVTQELIHRLEASFRMAGAIGNIVDSYKAIEAAHDQKDAWMHQMANLLEAQKEVSDQQQLLIDQLVKALPNLPDEEKPPAANTRNEKKKRVILVQTASDARLRALDPLRHVMENPNPSRTPNIPGQNAPKRGLGAAPKAEKPKKERVAATKKKVFAKDSATEQGED